MFLHAGYVYVSVCLTVSLCVCLSICLTDYQSVCLSVLINVYRSGGSSSTCSFILGKSVCLSVLINVCRCSCSDMMGKSVCLSVCLPIFLSLVLWVVLERGSEVTRADWLQRANHKNKINSLLRVVPVYQKHDR